METVKSPAEGRFVRSITDKEAISREKAWDIDPTLSPALININLVPDTPCEIWHRTDESDSQVVRSHAVLPSSTDPVYVTCPKLDPCTVKLAEPVAALLIRLIALVGDDSEEKG